MNPTTSPIRIQWLLDFIPDPPDTGACQIDLAGVPLPIQPDMGQGHFDKIHLPNGACFIRGMVHFLPAAAGRLLSIGEMHVDYFAPTFVVQTARRGRVCHQEFKPDAELIFGDGRDLFCQAQKRHILVKLDGSGPNEVITLHLRVDSLEAMLGQAEAAALLHGLGIQEPGSLALRQTTRPLRDLLHAALAKLLQAGPARKLFAQAKALEYVSALAEHLQGAPSPSDPSRSSRETIRALREHLMGLEGKLPTLETLAIQFALPARRMNDEFNREYGETIFSFIIGHRLDQAREVLRTSDLPIKVLADRLGYGHVNNFINAFTRRFGEPPGRVRRGARP